MFWKSGALIERTHRNLAHRYQGKDLRSVKQSHACVTPNWTGGLGCVRVKRPSLSRSGLLSDVFICPAYFDALPQELFRGLDQADMYPGHRMHVAAAPEAILGGGPNVPEPAFGVAKRHEIQTGIKIGIEL